jgi:hypothetical protein
MGEETAHGLKGGLGNGSSRVGEENGGGDRTGNKQTTAEKAAIIQARFQRNHSRRLCRS